MSERTSGSRDIRRLLVVDDHEDTREMLLEYFESLGFRVETAIDGKDAIAKALMTPPDVILLELELLDLDGWETIKALGGFTTTNEIPIVVCTAAGDEGIRRARELGCKEIARKPCSLAKLEAMVRSVLDAGAPKVSGGRF